MRNQSVVFSAGNLTFGPDRDMAWRGIEYDRQGTMYAHVRRFLLF